MQMLNRLLLTDLLNVQNGAIMTESEGSNLDDPDSMEEDVFSSD